MCKLKNALNSLLILAIITLNCTISISDNGGASETTNGFVCSANGTPIAGAVVRLVDSQNWLTKKIENESVVLDSVITDQNGKFVLKKDTTKLITNLQIDALEEALFIKDFADSSDSTIKFVLKKHSSVYGAISSTELKSSSVSIYGSTYSAEVSTKNQFTFKNVASGEFPLYLHTDSDKYLFGQYVDIPSEGTVENLVIKLTENNILIEDFNYLDFRFYRHPITKMGMVTNGFWYTFSTDANYSPSKNTVDTFAAVSFDFQASLGMSEYAIAAAGFSIGIQNSSYDFSSATSVSFYAKGQGVLRISIGSWKTPVDSFAMQKTVELTSEWKQYILPLNQFTGYNNFTRKESSITWDNLKSAVSYIELQFCKRDNRTNQHLQFIIDDIYINGITFDSLSRNK
jgi:hypothetical protein